MTVDDLIGELSRVDADLRSVVMPLTEGQGSWRPDGGRRWSVRQNVSHMAVTKIVYLRAMREAARRRRRSADAGIDQALGPWGRWFLGIIEPPPRVKAPAPRRIQPLRAGTLEEAVSAFLAAQDLARAFVTDVSCCDLQATFPNPFFRLLRVRLATGLLVLAAHDRRHLWQVRQVLAAPGFPSA